MSKKLELPEKEIARLVEEEDKTYKEVKEELGLECHYKTIGRHYRGYKESNKGPAIEGEELPEAKSIKVDNRPAREHIAEVKEQVEQETKGQVTAMYMMGQPKLQKEQTLWEKIKKFFRSLCRR